MDNEDQIKEVLSVIAQKYKLKKWRYKKKTLDNSLKNFIANLLPVLLIDEDNGEATDIYIKIAPVSPRYNKIITECFRREVYFYSTFVPIVQNNTDFNLDGLIPKCYYAESCNKKVVVLKDMTTEGFIRYKNRMFLDQDHIIATLQGVAKFHALSMIMRVKNIKLPDTDILRLESSYDDVSRCGYIKYLTKKYLYLFEGMHCETFLKSFTRYINDSNDFYDGQEAKAKCLVYGHGDLWRENILFKYSYNKPSEVCFVDYQLTCLMSPATEFLRVIMDNTETSIRRLHFKNYVSTYYQNLLQILRSQGVELEELYSEDDFNCDLQMTFPYCFGMSFFSFLLWFELETMETVTTYASVLPNSQNKNIHTFIKVIEDMVNDFQHLGYCEKFVKYLYN